MIILVCGNITRNQQHGAVSEIGVAERGRGTKRNTHTYALLCDEIGRCVVADKEGGSMIDLQSLDFRLSISQKLGDDKNTRQRAVLFLSPPIFGRSIIENNPNNLLCRSNCHLVLV